MSVNKYIISIAMIFALIAVSLSAVSAADTNNTDTINLDDMQIQQDDMGNVVNTTEDNSEMMNKVMFFKMRFHGNDYNPYCHDSIGIDLPNGPHF